MHLFVLGLNHKSAPIGIRERFAISEARVGEFLTKAAALPHVEEALAVFTCNRVEVYGASKHPQQARQQLSRFISEFQGVPEKTFEQHTYFFEGEQAIRHGFRVSASLDSMIVGEPQILGQMKDAYRAAGEAGTTGTLLNKFFHRAFFVAKKLRSETSIGSHPVSVSYAAVVLAKQIFGDLAGKKALILGAGKMSLLAIRHLKGAGIETLYLANRTPERAEEVARKVGGETIPFDKFDKWLADADIVVTSTSAEDYIVVPAKVQEAIKQRKNRPMFFIDIAVPRNVSPEVNHIHNIYLYDIDDLGQVVEANKNERVKEAERAEYLLEAEVEDFAKILRGLAVVPTLSSLSKKFDAICRRELDKTFQRMPQLDDAGREAVEAMAYAIVNKILHDPMVALKERGAEADQPDYSALVRKLFRLDEV
ncbi:MAG: glutamyl-tRNA reductase [Deltaproteobacteria bacterium]|nr:glutamyl-tRNA reductase [Deltaproteobacteria bacterium]